MHTHEREALDQCIQNVSDQAASNSHRLLPGGGFVNAYRVGPEIHWSFIRGGEFLKGIRQEDGSEIIRNASSMVSPSTYGIPSAAHILRIIGE
jgi:hypothetical protein